MIGLEQQTKGQEWEKLELVKLLVRKAIVLEEDEHIRK